MVCLAGDLGWCEHAGWWTARLLWLAGACLWNSVRCGRVHCVFTGPFFLVMAVVTVLIGFRIIWLGRGTWSLLSALILIGAIGLCCGSEPRNSTRKS